MAIKPTFLLGGLVGDSLYKSFTDKGPAAPALPSAPPPVDPSAAVRAGAAQRKKAASAYGARSTLLTGPAGITAPPPVTRKTLLGS